MKNDTTRVLPLTLDGKPEKPIALRAFLFDRQGALLEIADVKNDQASFSTSFRSVRDVRVLIAPADEGNKNIDSIESLNRYKPYEPVFSIGEKGVLQTLPIPQLYWCWWVRKHCRVTGTVKKTFDINGFSEVKTICDVRVHICEVDRISWIIYRIPDYIIDKIRLELIAQPVLVHPIGPDPGPELISEAPQLRTQLLSKKTAPAHGFTAAKSVQSAKAQVPSHLQSQLQNASLSEVRNIIIKNFGILHPIFCLWPWWWPWFYTCTEIAVVTTDLNGRFDVNLDFWDCANDPIDLYFWVEYNIGGVWTTVYHPSIPCHTYWNFACGSDITIWLTDPRVLWGCHNVLDGEVLWVKTVGWNTSVTHIKQIDEWRLPPAYGTTAFVGVPNFNKIGLTDGSYYDSPNTYGDFRRPFGGTINFIIQFGDGFPNNGGMYYRWSYRKLRNALLNPQLTGWSPLTNALAKGYTYIDGMGHFQSNSIGLGPLTVNGVANLFRIPVANLPGASAPFNVPEAFPHWDQNTVTASFDSRSLSGGDGLYEFKLEVFDSNGNAVALPRNVYQVPDPGTFVPSIDAPNEYLNLSGSNANSYKMNMRIDNNLPLAEIYKVQILQGGIYVDAASDCCGFVKYNLADINNPNLIKITFKAYHPYNFADFWFGIQKGTCYDPGQRAATDAASMVIGNTNGYTRDGFWLYSKTFSPATLLGICLAEEKAAFAEMLTVEPLSTDGTYQAYGTIGTTVAFAIEPI
ncbi:MAG: hypothetical protein Q8896_06905 [Bacteroidota bacterium]|nr:hypothetical protein [Bacteroidota bacterium]